MRFWWIALWMWGLAVASPASDLYLEAAQLLRTLYAGSSTVGVSEQIRLFQGQLDQACGQNPSCSVTVAAPIIRDLVRAIGDPHTNYYSPSQFAELQRELSGAPNTTPSIGVVLAVVGGVPGLLITDVVAGSPAEEAGLQRGDRIVRLGGVGLPSEESGRISYVRMFFQSGDPVQLTVQRGSLSLEVTVQGRVLSAERLPSLRLLEGGVALLRIPSFTTYAQVGLRVHQLVIQAQERGAKAMIVDVRDNPGGVISECLVAAGAFVDEPYRLLRGSVPPVEYLFRQGQIFGRAGLQNPLYTLTQTARWQGPLAVLVNEYSASCAEFFAQDVYERALIVGQPTRGVANTATTLQALSDGSGLQITTSKALRRDGQPYEAQVQPELLAADDLRALADGRDVVLLAALQALQQR